MQKYLIESSQFIKIPSTFPREIDDNLALGLDLGIGSCGQALVYQSPDNKPDIVNLPQFPDQITFLGVRAFDVPEDHEKTGVVLKNPKRREKRQLRKTTRRRARRMWQLRHLLKEHGILPDDYPTDENLWKHPPERGANASFDRWRDWHSQMTAGAKGNDGPWLWRVQGLDEKLAPLAWAATLLHIAKHRGFKSNRKSASSDDDGGKVLKALKENQQRMEENGYRTIGEMMLKDPEFQDRKRNSSGDYVAMIHRDVQEEEIRLLFKQQRAFGNLHASSELEDAYLQLYRKQLPLQNSITLLGDCPFEPGEKRAPRLSYSNELSRALQKINILKLTHANGSQTTLRQHIREQKLSYQPFIKQFGSTGNKTHPGRITWNDLRSIFQLDDSTQFDDLPTPTPDKKGNVPTTEKLEAQDFLTRSASNGAARGSYLLRNALGEELWLEFSQQNPAQLDEIAFALSFFEEIENDHETPEYWGVINQLRAADVDPRLIQKVHDDLTSDSPTLHKFADTAAMSLKAIRRILPLLQQGKIYSDACTEIYGDHRQHDFDFENITNPVVKSVVRECLKQVIHLIDETGKIPGRICVELARDLGKAISERNEISYELNKRKTRKEANWKNLKAELNRDPSPDELLRYELYLEQANTCPYCGETLGTPESIISTQFQVDHIIPRSRSHDNSYDNKVLVHIGCNQDKGNLTPFEWFAKGDEDSREWAQFQANVNALRQIRKHKRRHLLNTTFAEDEAKFAARHLNDTRYISRLVTHYLQEIYVLAGEKHLEEKGSTRRVFVQPGPLTSLVRKAWGLENLKKDLAGKRLGDKHHAVDALICALLSEGQRQFVTRSEQNKRAAQSAFQQFSDSYREMERQNDHHWIPRNVSPPWKNFRNDVAAALDLITVSRREIRKGRGSLHNDTLYSIRKVEDKNIAYTRKPILTLNDGKPLKKNQIDDIRGIHDERNQWLREVLTQWVEAGCPTETDQLPRDPQGSIIRRVHLAQRHKSTRKYPQGHVTGGDQVRLDVFSLTAKNGSKKYFLVPIYSYHLSQDDPPNKAIVANKQEDDWDVITEDHQFEFSLWKNSRIEIKKKPSTKKPNGEHILGLYKGINRNTGALEISDPDDSQHSFRASVKTGTLLFRKLETDRLGREFIVKQETRTWRGKNVD